MTLFLKKKYLYILMVWKSAQPAIIIRETSWCILITSKTMNRLLNLLPSPIFTSTRHFIKVTKSLQLNFIIPRHPKELQSFETAGKGYLQLKSHPTVNHDRTQEWNIALCHHKQVTRGHWWHVAHILCYIQFWDLQVDTTDLMNNESMQSHTAAKLASASDPFSPPLLIRYRFSRASGSQPVAPNHERLLIYVSTEESREI